MDLEDLSSRSHEYFFEFWPGATKLQNRGCGDLRLQKNRFQSYTLNESRLKGAG